MNKSKTRFLTGTITSTCSSMLWWDASCVCARVFMQQFSVTNVTLKCTTTSSVRRRHRLTCVPETRPVSSAFFSAPEETSRNTSYKRASCQTQQTCSCWKKNVSLLPSERCDTEAELFSHQLSFTLWLLWQHSVLFALSFLSYFFLLCTHICSMSQ